jgi:hypothetical protein
MKNRDGFAALTSAHSMNFNARICLGTRVKTHLSFMFDLNFFQDFWLSSIYAAHYPGRMNCVDITKPPDALFHFSCWQQGLEPREILTQGCELHEGTSLNFLSINLKKSAHLFEL